VFYSTKEPFHHIELEEITDEDDDDNQSLNNKRISRSIISDELLEHTANELVDSILTDILLLKNLNEDDTNSGVRELSEDENGLRELDENDMSDTDEFIVFAGKEERSNENQTTDNPRCSLNRLYTFSRTNDNGIDNSKQTISNQVCRCRFRGFFPILTVLV
jgi:hypothetical protein